MKTLVFNFLSYFFLTTLRSIFFIIFETMVSTFGSLFIWTRPVFWMFCLTFRDQYIHHHQVYRMFWHIPIRGRFILTATTHSHYCELAHAKGASTSFTAHTRVIFFPSHLGLNSTFLYLKVSALSFTPHGEATSPINCSF